MCACEMSNEWRVLLGNEQFKTLQRGVCIAVCKRMSPVRGSSTSQAKLDSEDLPLFSFGVVADVQYADKDNRQSTSMPDRVKYYRDARHKLKSIVDTWNLRKSDVKCAINLGDIIDGNSGDESTLKDLRDVLSVFSELDSSIRIHHAIGNHCLHAPREALLQELEVEQTYYCMNIHDGWKLIVLDTNDLGIRSENEQETKAFMDAHPSGDHPSMKPWNGGIASKQREWLESELRSCKETAQRVLLACHHPFGRGSCRETHMAWNAREMEEIVGSSGVVPLVLSGHDHPGGYAHSNGTHFLTLPGVVEVSPGSNSFAIVHVHANRIRIEGFGVVEDRTFHF